MTRIVYFMFLFFLVGQLSSCKRLGCMEDNSLNYDLDAKKDDGSCVYEGQLILWFSQFSSNNYVTGGVTDLVFIINNEVIGTIPATSYSTSIPTCEAPSGFLKTMKLGKVASKDFTVIVRDDQDNFLSQKSFVIDGNKCRVVQLN